MRINTRKGEACGEEGWEMGVSLILTKLHVSFSSRLSSLETCKATLFYSNFSEHVYEFNFVFDGLFVNRDFIHFLFPFVESWKKKRRKKLIWFFLFSFCCWSLCLIDFSWLLGQRCSFLNFIWTVYYFKIAYSW